MSRRLSHMLRRRQSECECRVMITMHTDGMQYESCRGCSTDEISVFLDLPEMIECLLKDVRTRRDTYSASARFSSKV